jgi:general secretion pathway protein D
MKLTRPIRRAAQVFTLVSGSTLACAGQSALHDPKPDAGKAAEAFLAGQRLVDRHDLAGAQADFARAAQLDPSRHDYSLALSLTRDQRVSELIQQAAKARLASHAEQADTLIASARKIDPFNELVLEHTATDVVPLRAEIVATRDPNLAGAIHLQPVTGTHDLHLRGDARQAVTQAASEFGIKAVFDESVVSTPVRIDLDHVSYATAMPIILEVGHLFAVPVDSKLILVAADTQENRAKFEHQLEETIYIPGSTPEQLNEITQVVKNVFDVQKTLTSAERGTLTIRAPEATIKAVNATLEDLLDGPADVQLQLRLVSFDRSHSLNTGATTPSSISGFSVAAEAQTLVSANQTLIQTAISSGALTLPSTNSYIQNIITEALFLVLSGAVQDAKVSGLLAVVGNGLTLFGISYGGSAGFNLALNSSEARALDDITVRVTDRQTSTLRVGEKYPITVSQYSSGISSATSSALAGATINGVSVASLLNSVTTAIVPQIQYEDLGITLKTTPTVLKSGKVAVHIDLKIEALTGASLDNIPILTSRNFVSDITVQDGETALMLSDLSRTEQRSVSGIPGIADIPGLADTAASTLRDTDGSELVLLVTPHLVRRRRNVIEGPRIAFHSTVPADY